MHMRGESQGSAKSYASFFVSRYGEDAIKKAALRAAQLGPNPAKRDKELWRGIIQEIQSMLAENKATQVKAAAH